MVKFEHILEAIIYSLAMQQLSTVLSRFLQRKERWNGKICCAKLVFSVWVPNSYACLGRSILNLLMNQMHPKSLHIMVDLCTCQEEFDLTTLQKYTSYETITQAVSTLTSPSYTPSVSLRTFGTSRTGILLISGRLDSPSSPVWTGSSHITTYYYITISVSKKKAYNFF